MGGVDTTTAPARARPGRRRFVFRAVRLAAFLVLLIAAVNGAVDFGRRREVCVRCSASSDVREFHFLGIGGKWGRITKLGRLATFIEKQDKRPCVHRWVTCWRNSGNLLYRSYEPGASDLDMFYLMMNMTKLDLEKMQEQDASFVEKLKQAIDSPDSQANQQIVETLMADAHAFIRDLGREP